MAPFFVAVECIAMAAGLAAAGSRWLPLRSRPLIWRGFACPPAGRRRCTVLPPVARNCPPLKSRREDRHDRVDKPRAGIAFDLFSTASRFGRGSISYNDDLQLADIRVPIPTEIGLFK